MKNVGSTVALALFVASLGRSAAAQLAPGDVQCRRGLALGMRRVVSAELTVQRACHRNRMLGRLGDTTDCNDSARAPRSAPIDRAVTHLTLDATSACAGSSSPSGNGYTACPTPCNGVSISDYASVGVCLACVAKAEVSRALAVAYGSLPAPPVHGIQGETACQTKIGRALQNEIKTWLREQRRCQLARDENPALPNTCRSDLTLPINRAIANSTRLLGRCDAMALSNLSSCSATITGEQSCINLTAATRAAMLFDVVYNPLTLLPTPTSTATVTPPTPSATPTCGQIFYQFCGGGSIGGSCGPCCLCESTNTPTLSPTPTVSPTVSPTTCGQLVYQFCGGGNIGGSCGPCCLCENTNTPTFSPTPTLTPTPPPSFTPTSCGADVPLVYPVTSPTNQLQQTIAGQTVHVANRFVRVSSEAGTVVQSLGVSAGFAVTIDLVPNQINHLTVCIFNVSCPSPPACTSVDTGGNPLEIAQVP